MADLPPVSGRMVKLAGALEAAVWLGLAVALLRLVPFRRLFREVPRSADGPNYCPELVERINRIRGAVGAVAARLPYGPTCLPRAFAGHLMCRVRGLRVPIALSVIGTVPSLRAHAYLLPGSDQACVNQTPAGRTHLGRIELAWS